MKARVFSPVIKESRNQLDDELINDESFRSIPDKRFSKVAKPTK